MTTKNIQIEDGEKILLEVRRHWFVFVLQSLPIIALALIPPVLYRAQNYFLGGGLDHYFTLGAFLYALWLLILWLFIFIRWTVYYLDIWVITDRRIFDVAQLNLFDRDVAVLRLDRIQDITIHVEGFFPTLLGYGDVQIETAGPQTFKFIIYSAPNPYDVKNAISAAHDEAMKG
jgi:uncharacterized membrane protein YdbT with pleckstrin-like domain